MSVSIITSSSRITRTIPDGYTTVQHPATGDAHAPPTQENLAHFGPPHDNFFELRLQHPVQRLLDVLQQR